GLRSNMIDAAAVTEVRAAGLGIGGWACNDAPAIANMFELRVDVFTTDRPDLALAIRDQRSRRCRLWCAASAAVPGTGERPRASALSVGGTGITETAICAVLPSGTTDATAGATRPRCSWLGTLPRTLTAPAATSTSRLRASMPWRVKASVMALRR